VLGVPGGQLSPVSQLRENAPFGWRSEQRPEAGNAGRYCLIPRYRIGRDRESESEGLMSINRYADYIGG
jgi:hypothetical protein